MLLLLCQSRERTLHFPVVVIYNWSERFTSRTCTAFGGNIRWKPGKVVIAQMLERRSPVAIRSVERKGRRKENSSRNGVCRLERKKRPNPSIIICHRPRAIYLRVVRPFLDSKNNICRHFFWSPNPDSGHTPLWDRHPFLISTASEKKQRGLEVPNNHMLLH